MHYLLSIIAGMASYVLGYGLIKIFVTRNLPDDSAFHLATMFIVNFSVAGVVSGAIYTATFRRGYLPIATIPATLFGALGLAVVIMRGEIGIGTIALNPWQFAIPVIVGIASSYISAKVMRRFLLPKM